MAPFERRYAEPVSRGTVRFVFDDLGALSTDTLRTHAVPWKVIAAALMLESANGDEALIGATSLTRELERYGFLFPTAIENWTAEPSSLTFENPLGLVTGIVKRGFPEVEIEVANLSCAACHAGVLYDHEGLPQHRVWLGLPNTSINFEAYSQAAYRSLKRGVRSRDALFRTIVRLFPRVTRAEMKTIERYVLPALDQRLEELERMTDTPTPFSNGGPGLTNGIGSLKRQLGLISLGTFSPEAPLVSIPDLDGVLLRSSFLADGVYGLPGTARFERRSGREISPVRLRRVAEVVSFFTVPAMGMRPHAAIRAIPRVEEIVAFLQAYRAPRFPSRIDGALAERGRALYDLRCATCHGVYTADPVAPALIEFPNRLSPAEEIATDSERWRSITLALTRAVLASPFRAHIVPASARGYVAPRLGGLWATAPYLHNGSVPTLWHLMHPQERPTRFWVGGHRLDFTQMGIAGFLDEMGIYRYPAGYEPWSTPVLYDTTAPGRSNRGHEAEFVALSELEKVALLEFLKQL